MSRISDKTQSALAQFLRDVKSLSGESPKTHRFAALLGELFPGTKVATEFSEGVEKLVRVDTTEGKKRRRIDAYYGNAVIEFEASLKVTGREAERQLREYSAGVWGKESKNQRHLIAIASDGVTWKSYRPYLKQGVKGEPKPEDVELELVQEFTLSEKNLDFFWMWLTILLFRLRRLDATSEHFRLDFGVSSQAFRVCLQVMRAVWRGLKNESEPKLAFKTWQKYLAVTYGSLSQQEEDLEELFLKHTYLACVARLLIWAALSKGKTSGSLRDVAFEVLSGRFFQARNLANLVEDDFFQWVRHSDAEKQLAPVWERIIAQLQSYDLDHLKEDVFKGVYQDLVDPKDRHDLGEYYTPDWLCERMIAELLPRKGFVPVLDPTCGSGSFLRAAIDHFLRNNPNGSPSERLYAVLDNVVGIDIQPLAATISRATYVLSLGELVKAAKRPIQIPVYLADSLFLPSEVKQPRLDQTPVFEIRFGDRFVEIPESLVKSPDLFDISIAACTRVAVDHAKEQKETKHRLARYLDRETDDLKNHKEREQIIASLWEFTDELSKLILRKENSIWGFIVRNSYKPGMLKGRFDVIIGNPPWLSYRYISDPDYQAEVKKRALKDYAIAPAAQKLFTQMELATVILAHSINWFGKKRARLGFVMPRSILSADQHTKLRTRQYNASFRLTAYWDLFGVQPLFKVPACVLFVRQDEDRGDISDRLPALEWEGKLPLRDVPWVVAEKHLARTSKNARVIYLGERDALSTSLGRTTAGLSSPYVNQFQNGATIYLRSFYFVRIRDLDGMPDLDRLYWAETDPEQARDAQPPYDELQMSGNVEGRFIYCTALAKHVLPFTLLDPARIIVPVETDGAVLSVLTSESLQEKGFRDLARWMQSVEDIWNEKRQNKADRQTVYEWLDYQGKLTGQNLRDRHLVLYCASGTNMVATTMDRDALPLRFLVDHKTYWGSFTTDDEACYLAAILNSDAVNQTIKPFQSMGLMGERDIHKKVLDVPFPQFNKDNTKHRDLVRLGKEAADQARPALKLPDFPGHLPRQRAFIRAALKRILAEIDSIVETLI